MKQFVCLSFFLLLQHSLQIPLTVGEKEKSESPEEEVRVQTEVNNGSRSAMEPSNQTDAILIRRLEVDFLLSAEESNGTFSTDNQAWEKACSLFEVVKDNLPEGHRSCNASQIGGFKEEQEDDCTNFFFVARLDCLDGVERQCDLQVFFSPLNNFTSLSNSSCFSVSSE